MSDADSLFGGSIPEIYDAYLGPMLFEPFARELAKRVSGSSGVLLELGAGTGRLTRALADAAPHARIVATDLNRPMLDRAARVVASRRVEWWQADAQTLPFADGGFDAVLSQFTVMFFPDKPAAFAEARRVLRPGGRFVFNVWEDLGANDLQAIAHQVVGACFPDDPPKFLARTPFGYHDREVIRSALAGAGFKSIDFETVRRETASPSAFDAAFGFCNGTPLRAEIEARDPARLASVTEAVAEAIRRRFGDGPVVGHGQALAVDARR